MWVAYWRKARQTEQRVEANSIWPAVLIMTATIIAAVAATGAFGLAAQLVGVVLLIPLLPLAILLLVGAPAMVAIWLTATISSAINRLRQRRKS